MISPVVCTAPRSAWEAPNLIFAKRRCIQCCLSEEYKRQSNGNKFEAAHEVRDLIRRLEKDGWVKVAHRGSHRQFKHPIKMGKVTVPGKMSDDLPEGTYRSILRQAGLED